MFVESGKLSSLDALQADVCVIGAGAAGISVAKALAGSSLSVLLLESGGLEPGTDGPSIYRVVPGRELRLGTDETRPWHFGGNTNNWSGNCRPLDEEDFLQRDWIPHSGWPLSRRELLPYYERAQAIAGLGAFRWYDVEACRPHLEHQPLDVDPGVLVTRIMHICPVPSFAELHCEGLRGADNVRVLLGARAARLDASAGGGDVRAVEIVTSDGRRTRVEASTFVLAAGGVENARLLLCSRGAAANDLDTGDLVGRFFMEHWYVDIPLAGWDAGLDLALYNFDSRQQETVGGAELWAQLVLSEDLMRNERVPGLSLWFLRLPRSSPSVAAMRRMMASILRRVPIEPLTDLRLLLSDPQEVPRYLVRRISERSGGVTEGHVLRVQVEQTPRPENRIRLSPERDRFGEPLPELTLRLAEGELGAHSRSLEIAASEIGLNGARVAKQMKLLFAAGRVGFFWHHTGTTRMHDDPAQGVVDRDCRVHGVSNLYVAGSSVFPTEGTAAPTLTILALALRLADHISGAAAASRGA